MDKDPRHEDTVKLSQKAARTGKRQFLGALIDRDGIFNIYIIAELPTKDLRATEPTLLPAKAVLPDDALRLPRPEVVEQ